MTDGEKVVLGALALTLLVGGGVVVVKRQQKKRRRMAAGGSAKKAVEASVVAVKPPAPGVVKTLTPPAAVTAKAYRNNLGLVKPSPLTAAIAERANPPRPAVQLNTAAFKHAGQLLPKVAAQAVGVVKGHLAPKGKQLPLLPNLEKLLANARLASAPIKIMAVA